MKRAIEGPVMHRISEFEARKEGFGDPRGLRGGRSKLTRYCEVHDLKKGVFED